MNEQNLEKIGSILLALWVILILTGIVYAKRMKFLDFSREIKSGFKFGSRGQKTFIVFLLFISVIFVTPTILYAVAILGELIYPTDTTGLGMGFGVIYAGIGAILSSICLILTKSYLKVVTGSHEHLTNRPKKSFLNTIINILILLFFLALFAYPIIRSNLTE